MRDDRIRLEDIVEAAEAIEKYAARGRPAFEQDELIQSWIVRHLQNIGEAARRYRPDAVWDAIGSGVHLIKQKAQAILSEL